ncbi:flavodoxin family protein [Clostridium botulinum]|uniref:flavodoxin family protein n=1 Tax=Clostridium botulinum TaxID=1491 RepID=UPI0006A48339|nr:flavodoxin [Clostridium botulinum]KOC46073.1 flavodoxin [Clostridium botulinum]
MKSLIVYYSLEGNSKFIAESINEGLKGDILRIKPIKDVAQKGFFKKYLLGGTQAMLKNKPQLEPISIDFSNYDFIVFGTPVWAGTYAPVFNTFFEKYTIKNKRIALFCCHGGGGSAKTFKVFKEKLYGNNILGEIEFKDPLKHETEKMGNEAKVWIKEFIK